MVRVFRAHLVETLPSIEEIPQAELVRRPVALTDGRARVAAVGEPHPTLGPEAHHDGDEQHEEDRHAEDSDDDDRGCQASVGGAIW